MTHPAAQTSIPGARGGLPVSYFQTVTILPSATANQFGAQVVFVPPDPFDYFLPLHIGLSTQGTFVSETLTIRVQGQFSDGSQAGASANYASVQGDVDPQNLLYGLVDAANGNAGQQVYGKLLQGVAMDCKSTIPSSLTSAIMRLWAVIV